MLDLNSYKISSKLTLGQALSHLEKLSDEYDTLFVIEDGKLIGTLADSDVRRTLISKDISHDDDVTHFMQTNFHYFIDNEYPEGKELELYEKYVYIPVVDSSMTLLKFVKVSELNSFPNKVVLMAGGLGSRLRPLTNVTPKPMLYVGAKPIIETIIDQFKSRKFSNFYISVNYKANHIKDYFDNGENFNCSIKYLEETKKLGTAGCLSLIDEQFKSPFFVMNGDLLTNINFADVLEFHESNNFVATMCCVEYVVNIPYGVIETNDDKQQMHGIVEKPDKKFLINGGVYLLNPELKDQIPKDEFYDMPSLFKKLIAEDKKVGTYVFKDYWMDIGHPEDYEKANQEFNNHF